MKGIGDDFRDAFGCYGENIISMSECIGKLKVPMKFNTPTGLSDMEKEPAYKRRNIQLENVPASNESQVSRFTLTNDPDNKPEIKSNNTFLHDRVD